MKKYSLILVFALNVLAFASCSKMDGTGPSVTRNYDLKGFTAVDNTISADVNVTQGVIFKVEIQGQANIIDHIETPVVNNELRIIFKDNFFLGIHDRITVNITMPAVTGLKISGSGKISAPQTIKAGAIDLAISGSGEINLAALTAANANADISGSGSINVRGDSITTETNAISGSGNLDFSAVPAKNVSADISGSGNATVYATKSLDVNIAGSGNVSYTGTPVVNSKISGSGSLKHF